MVVLCLQGNRVHVQNSCMELAQDICRCKVYNPVYYVLAYVEKVPEEDVQ